MNLKIHKHILRMECQDLLPVAPPIEIQMRYSPTVRVEFFWVCADDFLSSGIFDEQGLTPTQIKGFSFKRALLCQKLMRGVYSDAFIDDLLDGMEDALDEWDNIVNDTWTEVELIIFNNVGKKTVDKYWNSMKSAYGSDYRFTDQEIFDALDNRPNV